MHAQVFVWSHLLHHRESKQWCVGLRSSEKTLHCLENCSSSTRSPANDEGKSSCLMPTGWKMGGKNSFWNVCLRNKGYSIVVRAILQPEPRCLPPLTSSFWVERWYTQTVQLTSTRLDFFFLSLPSNYTEDIPCGHSALLEQGYLMAKEWSQFNIERCTIWKRKWTVEPATPHRVTLLWGHPVSLSPAQEPW